MTRLGNLLIIVNDEKFCGDPSGLDPDGSFLHFFQYRQPLSLFLVFTPYL